MNRRQFLLSAGAALAPRVLPTGQAALPNIVFILADDLGWADLGAYGADLHETPNLDRLAGEGVRFTRAYAASPVCTPTRASIHTGRHPARLHMTIWRENAHKPPANARLLTPMAVPDLPHGEPTLAGILRAAGYRTAHVGKWHLGDFEHYPEAHGFDINIGGTGWGAPQTFFYPYDGTRHWGGGYRYVPGLHGGKPGEYLTDRLTTEALRIMDSTGNAPFFLSLNYHTVHTPIEAKPDVVDRYRARLRPELHHKNATYAAMVHALDENVGRILDRIDRGGLANNTIVVFTSDNGGYIGRWQGDVVTDNYPLRSGKGSLYEGGIRVPLIVRSPGTTPRGTQVAEPVCSIDLLPTLLEMAGLGVDGREAAKIDGKSFAPLLRHPGAGMKREELYFHFPHYYETTTPVSSILAGEWKLLKYYEGDKVELYRLGQDPREERDLAAKEPGRAAMLRRRLEEWLRSVNAQLPQPSPGFTPRK